MKKIITTKLFLLLMLGWTIGQEANSDDLSLEGVLSIFEKSNSIEDFENQLNTDNYYHNLDLNEDGEIDYLRVEDRTEDDVHAIVIQAIVDENEVQDVAVIEIEKTGKESATLQIVGDEEIYGEQVIVEPFDEEGRSDGSGPGADYRVTRVVVNVFFWSPVRHIYRPAYRPWVSPFRWRVYPKTYRPWRVRPIATLHRHRVVHNRFHRVSKHRVTRAHKVYTPHRKTSTRVVKRTKVVRGKNGVARKKTVTKTKTVKKDGKNKKVVKKKTKTVKKRKK